MNPPPRRLRARARLPSPPDNPFLTRHQAFIRALPCVSCGKPAPSECAQVRMHAGLGIPASDRYLVPLCGPATVWQDCCHSRKLYRGAACFWSELGIDPLDLAAQLWRVSGDVTAGLRAVMRARQAAARQRRIRRNGKGSSPRCALDRRAALGVSLRPTALVISPMSSELPLLVESRS
jgi:hypothetical protein